MITLCPPSAHVLPSRPLLPHAPNLPVLMISLNCLSAAVGVHPEEIRHQEASLPRRGAGQSDMPLSSRARFVRGFAESDCCVQDCRWTVVDRNDGHPLFLLLKGEHTPAASLHKCFLLLIRYHTRLVLVGQRYTEQVQSSRYTAKCSARLALNRGTAANRWDENTTTTNTSGMRDNDETTATHSSRYLAMAV